MFLKIGVNIMSTILGVDFGTSNSCISIFRGQDYKIIQNEYGKYTTPSCIYFDRTSEDILYGDVALQQSDVLKNGTFISNIKRLFGITYHEFSNDSNLKSFFKTLHVERCRESNYCCIVLQHNNIIKRLTPHYIAEIYLKWLLNIATSTINDASNDVVITVPVKFTNNQRLLLKQILKNIGYNPIRILNEPTAATIAYTIGTLGTLSKNRDDDVTENVLVVDCGGGTTDFTLLEADYLNMYFEVIDTSGDPFLGGEDITDTLTTYILSKIKCDITSKITKRVKTASEICKQNLTYKSSDNIILENVCDKDYIINVSRNILEQINVSWFARFTNSLIEISKDRIIDKVILVGGTTLIPKITSIIENHLSNKIYFTNNTNTKMDPDYMVSIGAAYQGYLLNNNVSEKIDMTFIDTISMSLGIKTIGDIMTPIISKNTMIPCSHTETFVTTDSDTTVDIEVYQGERRFVKDNLKLGTFHIKRSKSDQETIQITFDITSDGILIVTARNMDDNTEMSTTFDNLTKSDIDISNYIYSDDTEKVNDMELSNLILAKIELSNTVNTRRSITESNVKGQSLLNDPNKYNEYINLVKNAENTIDNYSSYTAEFLTEYKKQFEKRWNEINFL